MPIYLSSKHAAERLDLPVKTFNRLVKREGIKCYPLGPRLRRYKAEDIDRSVEAMRLRPRRRRTA